MGPNRIQKATAMWLFHFSCRNRLQPPSSQAYICLAQAHPVKGWPDTVLIGRKLPTDKFLNQDSIVEAEVKFVNFHQSIDLIRTGLGIE